MKSQEKLLTLPSVYARKYTDRHRQTDRQRNSAQKVNCKGQIYHKSSILSYKNTLMHFRNNFTLLVIHI